MAVTLPTFADLPSIDPRSVGSQPSYPQNDAVAEGTGTLGKGIEKVGGTIADYAAEQQRNRNAVNSALATADLEGNLIRDKELLANETDPEKIDAIKGRLRGYLDRAGKTITDPEHRELWAAQHSVKVAQTEAVADARQHKIYDDRFLAGAGNQLSELSRLAAQASNPEDREEAKRRMGEVIGSMEKAGVIGSAKSEELARSYAEDIISGHAQWLDANGKPGDALAFVQQNAKLIDPKKLEALTTHLRPQADKDAGNALAERSLGGGGAGGDVERFLDLAKQDESSGQNINQQVVGPNGGYNPSVGRVTGPSSASGYWQIINPTWEKFAPQAGVDLAKYPTAKSAPEDVQRSVARVIATTDGVQHWTDYNKTLRAHAQAEGLPVSGPITGRAAPAVAVASAGPRITVAGADPEGKSYELTQAQADQYYGIQDFPAQQRFLEALDTPAPQSTAYPQTAPAVASAPPGPPDWRAAADRIESSSAPREVKDAAIAALKHKQGVYELGQSQAASDLTLAVARGEAGKPEIETAYQQSKISPAVRTHLQQLIDKQDAKKQAQAEAILKVSGAGNGGAPLDPKSDYDKKALNLHYSVTAKGWPADQALDRSLSYAAQYGMVPDGLKAMVRGGLHSGRPDQAVVAADTVSRLRNANPQLVGDIGDENDLRLATLISTYSSAGVAPEPAVKMAVEGMKVSKTDREARVEDFEQQRGKTEKERRDADDTWIGGQKNSLWVRDPNVDPVMRKEFEELSKAEFQRTGNLEAARRLALDGIDRTWARSRVGGDLRYMKFAPEKFYGLPTLSIDENSRWMNEQLLADVSKGAAVDPSNLITTDRLRLLPAPDKANGGAPVYQVWLAGPEGNWQQVIDGKGAPITWFPDWNSSADRKRREEAKQAPVNRAREERRIIAEPPPMVPNAVQ